MDRRLKLHQHLIELIKSDNVYFQPPESLKMKYPCIRYELDNDWKTHANNQIYLDKDRYLVTAITANPDNDLRKMIGRLPYCQFSRHFRADNLNHYVYNLYY